MTELNLNEIKARAEAVRTWKPPFAVEPIPEIVDVDVPALVAEVEQLRDALTNARAVSADRIADRDKIARDVMRERDEATAALVAASERRDYFEARCEQMERDHAETVAEVERLRDVVTERETEVDHQAALVAEALADRDRARDVAVALEQENAHLSERLSKATRFEIDMLPEDDINAGTWKVSVEYRGRGKWAVLRGGQRCLSTDGAWDWEPREREDEWLAAHRFDLDDALRLAEEHAPKLIVNGFTAAEFQARNGGEPS